MKTTICIRGHNEWFVGTLTARHNTSFYFMAGNQEVVIKFSHNDFKNIVSHLRVGQTYLLEFNFQNEESLLSKI